jgi:hypothetical protein
MSEGFWLLIIAIISLLLGAYAFKGRKQKTKRAVFTAGFKRTYQEVEYVKRLTLSRSRIPHDLESRLNNVARQICTVGLVTQDLTVQELFAAVFLVNKLFHDGDKRALKSKNYFQRIIVLYHSNKVRLALGRGKYSGTYEMSHGIWSTHVPKHIIRAGNLDRAGKPGVSKLFRGTPRHTRCTIS